MIRSFLYPLGLLANLLFGVRFWIQWMQSEKHKQSTVSRTFWRLSFVANVIMCLHGYIQLQYPVCLIQGLNATIAWRNLNLMGEDRFKLKTMLTFMGSVIFLVTAFFFLQANVEWMRAPSLPWTKEHVSHLPLLWHLMGVLGMVLFASRFWIQWWLAEKHQRSFLGKSFWWTSLIGALFSLAYFIRLTDLVNILGYSMGLIPYFRNLMLMQKKAKPPEQQLPPDFKRLFLFAGEQSGDVLGGNLIRALKETSPSLELYGVGGREMQAAGMSLSHPMERFQVMGFSDVFKSLPRLYTDFRKIKLQILKERPEGIVFIDFPDFNMRLARALRKEGYRGKLIHYVCPSVWAWRKGRIKSLTKTLDHLLCVLPFETSCFAQTSLPVTYVGHPLIAAIDNYTHDPQWKVKPPLIAIFPGSRRQEIELNLPLQFAAAKKLGPTYTLAVSVARPDLQELIQKYVDNETLLVASDKRYELMKHAHVALATSGTIILELGLHSVPTVVTYRISPFNYVLGRYLFRIHLPYYTLVNIICEKEVYPEFIHRELSVETIADALKQFAENPTPCKQECTQLRSRLQMHDASAQAAKTILKEIQ